MTALVVRADAHRLPLPDASVDLVVTSPPYFALRSYTDGGEHYAGQVGAEGSPQEFIQTLLAVTRECVRVLKPSGSLWVNLGDKYSQRTQTRRSSHQPGMFPGKFDEFAETWAERAANGAVRMPRQNVVDDAGRYVPEKSLMGLPWRYALGCIDELGLILRAEVIWAKPNGLPESVTDRVRRSHETWFHMVKEPRYFSAVDEIREPHSLVSVKRAMPHRADPGRRGSEVYGEASNGQTLALAQMNHPLGRLPGSVWEVPTQPLTVPASLGVDHFAAFPMAWPRRLIRAWSPFGGVVLDPFGGTGTTALVAASLGRVGVSVDLSHDYSRLARWRTTDPGERARALQVDKPPVQVDGQEDLFGAAS